jgi:hypothetical protein
LLKPENFQIYFLSKIIEKIKEKSLLGPAQQGITRAEHSSLPLWSDD